MTNPFSRLSLPLLMKELIEQSAKRRLFITRGLYALLLYVLATVMLIPMLSRQQFTPLNMLGFGKQLYLGLVVLQFMGIYLFLPAISCGVISVEKERNTLALLFLTKLTSRTIILEKLGSRLVVMLNLLLISLPLLAFTYALGGTNVFDLICGVWFLFLAALLVSSVSILASAWYRSTISAFLSTYFILFVVSFTPAITEAVVIPQITRRMFQYGSPTSWVTWLTSSNPAKLADLTLAILFPPGLFVTSASQATPSLGTDILLMFLSSLPTLCCVAACIVLAQGCLFSRAFVPPSNPLLNVFQMLDSVFHQANKRFTLGVILVKDAQSLPVWQPVAWRESAKRSLGQFRYLVRILVLLEIPTLYFVLQSANRGGGSAFFSASTVSSATVSVVLGVLWMIIALLISTTAANLVTGERSRQTLEVLLASPMTSRQIILEKMSGVRRLMAVCAIPLLTCLLFQTWWRQQLSGRLDGTSDVQAATFGYRTQYFIWHEYLVSGLLTMSVYLPLMAWLALWMGIRCKSPARAILAALATLVAWCVLPAVVTLSTFQYLFPSYQTLQQSPYAMLMLILLDTPAALIMFTEIHGLHWLHPMPYLAALLNTVVYGTCGLLIRRNVLRHADRYLGRGDSLKIRAETVATVSPLLQGGASPIGGK